MTWLLMSPDVGRNDVSAMPLPYTREDLVRSRIYGFGRIRLVRVNHPIVLPNIAIYEHGINLVVP